MQSLPAEFILWAKKTSKVNKNEEVKIDKYHIWVSYNQMIDLIKKQKFDIEARLLFACSNFENII